MGLRLSVQQAWSREEWLRRKLEFGKQNIDRDDGIEKQAPGR